MSYKNDHLLVIINKYGKAIGDAKSEIFETYDKITDLTVGGPSIGGQGFGPTASFMLNLARLVAPASFMPVLGNAQMNIPGTSYFSPASGGNSITPGGQAAFGMSELGQYPGFPTGGAASLATAVGAVSGPVLFGIGSKLTSLFNNYTTGGVPTGAAASVVGNTIAPMAGAATGVAAGAGKGSSIILPTAGVVAGIGGLMSSLGPYFGPFGLAAGLAGNLAQGFGGAVLNTYQRTTGRIINNADTILAARVKNLESVTKMIGTEIGIIRKMLKERLDADSKALQEI